MAQYFIALIENEFQFRLKTFKTFKKFRSNTSQNVHIEAGLRTPIVCDSLNRVIACLVRLKWALLLDEGDQSLTE